METSLGSAWIAVYEWMAAVMIDGADRADLADHMQSPSVTLRT
jgi:hypothetical protein